MKQHIRTIIATVTLLFTTLGVWANGTIVKVIKLNGTEESSMSPGTVTVSENGTTRTITITPSKGYYLIKNGVSALRTITTNTPSVRNKTPGIDEGTITISGEYPTDLSGETSLTFTMPESPYDVEITADFGNRIDITNATLTLDNNEYTYDGTAKTPSVTLVTTSEGTEYTLTPGTDYTADYSNNTNVPENANSPQPTVTITGISQYTGTATQTFTINKAAASLTAPTAKELTYTGAAQELINTGSSNDGEMQYKLSTDTEWSTSIPKGTDKGTYTVNYKVIGDANHNDTESADVQVTIGAKSIANATITLSKESFDYNGETQKPEVTSVKDGETSLTANKDYTITNEGGKDVNTYTVSITGTGNYTGTATKDFTINKVAASLTAPTAKELTYTGAAQELINTGSSNDGEMQYKLSTDTEWSTSIPKGTDKGTYTVNYKVIGDANHNDTESADVQVTIGAKSIANATITLSKESFDYNGETQKPDITSVKDGETALTLDKDYTVTNEGGKDVNTYTVTITGTGNYTGTATKNFTINKANAEITKAPTAKTLTYTSTAQALVEAGTVSAGTLKYSKTIDGTFAEAIPEETNAGTYTVYYKVDGNENYNGIEASETNKVSVTINPATITGVTLTESALVYNGESQTVEIATVTAGTLVLTNENTDFAKVFDISGNSATERGTHTVTITAKENSNFTGSATADFSIKYTTTSLDWFEFAAGQTFGTFYYPEENLELPETIKAYIITSVNGNSVTISELNYIPMGVPVLVEKIEGTATRPEANPETTSNMLKYASENASLNRSAGTLYVLYNGMFVRATNNTVAVQNVYLQVPVSTPNSARTLSIKGGDGTTAIESVNRIESSDTDRWYDMQGRRIERPTKTGIYLNNGKKVVIK